MVSRTRRIRSAVAVVASTAALGVLLASATRTAADQTHSDELTFSNATGVQRTLARTGSVDTHNAFFEDVGSNGRTCVTCHQPAQAWSITPSGLVERFNRSAGRDPVFRTNDGSNCEGADISTVPRRRKAFSLLLTKGLIRVGLPVKPDAEFEIVDVDDPYRCGALLTEASMYRRPLPTTNLGFISTVMWDGRETVRGQSIREDLVVQASDATTGHAQGAAPSRARLEEIVDFELNLFTAQTHDNRAGSLTARGAFGGPRALSRQPFCIGVNDPLGMLPVMPGACAIVSAGLDPNVFTMFGSWLDASSHERRAIARGERLFNSRAFVIDGVAGLNGAPTDPVGGPIQSGTCTVCHDTPNGGNHSVSMPLNIGLADAARRPADLPLYTLRNKTTGATMETTGPGRAMITGRWADIGKFKGPVLRALAARAPYFHNGAAATLDEALDFYERRFQLGLSGQERSDLIAFLKSL